MRSFSRIRGTRHQRTLGDQVFHAARLPLISCNVCKRRNSTVIKNGPPFRMAVLGSGPAGFYTAYKVMSTIENAVVDMYEALPVPFGLVRFGVAPDHPEVKVSRKKPIQLFFPFLRGVMDSQK